MNIYSILLITRVFQICLCLASWILTFVYTPAIVYGKHVVSTWFQCCGIGPLTVLWLIYINAEPRRVPERTSAVATIICDLFINALWLVFWLWPVIENAGKPCFPYYEDSYYFSRGKYCLRRTDDPVVLGLAVPAWASFVITSGLIIYSAWPFYKKGLLKQCQVRVGGMVYHPEAGLEATELGRVSEETLNTTDKHVGVSVQTEQV